MSEREKPFTVSDRRHFTADGLPREGEASNAELPPDPGPRRDPGDPRSMAAPAKGQGTAAAEPSADFASFVLSLAAQAGALLGGEGLPEGASSQEALEGARSIISILEMLKQKTEGRRTPPEDEVMEGLLFELRMEYVAKAKASGA
jgi:hypothetical protein